MSAAKKARKEEEEIHHESLSSGSDQEVDNTQYELGSEGEEALHFSTGEEISEQSEEEVEEPAPSKLTFFLLFILTPVRKREKGKLRLQ